MNESATRSAARWKSAVIVLGALLALIVLVQRLEAPRDALAQVPDAGLQRLEMVKQLEEANKHLASAVEVLKQIRDQRVEEKKKESPK